MMLDETKDPTFEQWFTFVSWSMVAFALIAAVVLLVMDRRSKK